jgi:hypothetical protein
MKHATEFYLRVQQEESRPTRLKAHTFVLIGQKNKQFKGIKNEVAFQSEQLFVSSF